jgi:hypothetical protein
MGRRRPDREGWLQFAGLATPSTPRSYRAFPRATAQNGASVTPRQCRYVQTSACARSRAMPTNANPCAVFLAPSQFINPPRPACCQDLVRQHAAAARLATGERAIPLLELTHLDPHPRCPAGGALPIVAPRRHPTTAVAIADKVGLQPARRARCSVQSIDW